MARPQRSSGGSVPSRPLGMRIGDALGVTSSRRAALLAAVVCVLVLSVTVPLRNYLGQRAELAGVYEQEHILADKIAELERRRSLLADPQNVQTQARERLRYVFPGETPYVVQLPDQLSPGATAAGNSSIQAPTQLWYSQLWKSINGG
jgi:cell division protein FtsB